MTIKLCREGIDGSSSLTEPNHFNWILSQCAIDSYSFEFSCVIIFLGGLGKPIPRVGTSTWSQGGKGTPKFGNHLCTLAGRMLADEPRTFSVQSRC